MLKLVSIASTLIYSIFATSYNGNNYDFGLELSDYFTTNKELTECGDCEYSQRSDLINKYLSYFNDDCEICLYNTPQCLDKSQFELELNEEKTIFKNVYIDYEITDIQLLEDNEEEYGYSGSKVYAVKVKVITKYEDDNCQYEYFQIKAFEIINGKIKVYAVLEKEMTAEICDKEYVGQETTPKPFKPSTKSPTTTTRYQSWMSSTSTTKSPTTAWPTTAWPTTAYPTYKPTTSKPTTAWPTTGYPTYKPTTNKPTTAWPTTAYPTYKPTTNKPTTAWPTTAEPTYEPTTNKPTTAWPTTAYPTYKPTTNKPTTSKPTTAWPTTSKPTTAWPTTAEPTYEPTTNKPTTAWPTTAEPTYEPTTRKPTTAWPTTAYPTYKPTTKYPTTAWPTTVEPTRKPTTPNPTTGKPTPPQPNTVPPKTTWMKGTSAPSRSYQPIPPKPCNYANKYEKECEDGFECVQDPEISGYSGCTEYLCPGLCIPQDSYH